jgi:hypothetical protein
MHRGLQKHRGLGRRSTSWPGLLRLAEGRSPEFFAFLADVTRTGGMKWKVARAGTRDKVGLSKLEVQARDRGASGQHRTSFSLKVFC